MVSLRRKSFLVILLLYLCLLISCGGGTSGMGPLRGVFVDAPVAGLDYTTTSGISGKTDANGMFYYDPGDTVTFKIGSLTLGSAKGASQLTPVSIVPGGTISDQRVVNMLVFLQTLDEDGDLNNGIQINASTAAVVSANASKINFNQTPTAFAADTNITTLLTTLNNTPGVFADKAKRGDRTLRSSAMATEHFERTIAERIVIDTLYGKVSGFAATENTWQWLGIPYAKPPVGDLRWKPPQPPEKWDGVRDATSWSDQCAQNPALQRYGEGGMSEDCLYLNVTAPKNAKNLPVMVWFHGGGFTSLTSNTKAYNNPKALTTKGIVLVTVNHRIGPFGYIAHPWLSQESGYNGSGNYGQLDLIMALKWVKNNISNFGGNPNNVTIFGESGGGRKVLSLLASPLAAGLFHKAISQSGTLIPDTRTLSTAESIGLSLSSKLNVNNLQEMRAKSWREIVTAAAQLSPYTNIDNYYLPYSERVSFESKKNNDVPFFIVVNNNDTTDPINTIKNVFPWMNEYCQQKHFACIFTRVPKGWLTMGLKAYHAAELTYVFNYPPSLISHYQMGLVTDPATGKSIVIGDLNGNGTAADNEDILLSAGWSAEDDQIADKIMEIWTNFAKNGVPSMTGFEWPAYTKTNDTYVEFGANPVVKKGLSQVFP